MNSTVLITEDPILKIVATALRFANFALIKEDWGEVYGLLQGKNEGNKVIISDAIPFTHTRKDESELFLRVGFSNEDYVAAATLSEKITPEFFVGWYHSHPAIDLFLSDFDVETSLGYQNQNPDAVALVVDPFLLLKNLDIKKENFETLDETVFGFKIFRLRDLELGVESDFIEVGWEFKGNIFQTRKKINSLIDKIPEYLPFKNVEDRFQKFIEINKKKVDNQFYSLHDYIKQIKKKNKKKCQEIFVKQSPDIQKVNTHLKNVIEDRIKLLEFLEYKENDLKEQAIQEFKNFLDYIIEIDNKLEELRKEIS